jgi:hypothetical protein
MSKLGFTTLALAALLAVPAFAQSTSSATASPSSSTTATTSAKSVQARQTITNQLEKDGYKNVNVVADSFLVHATNKEGQSVVMIINPDSVFSMTDVGTANGTAKTAAK